MTVFIPYYAMRFFAVEKLRRECQQQRAVVLTYDDGPGTCLTQSVINLLNEYNAKATFFLLGRRVVPNENLVESLKSEEHDLGVHTFDHGHAWKLGATEAVEDINAGYEAASRWVPPDGLFRPPHGKLSYSTWRALRKRGARICWWTLDSGDTWPVLPSPQRTVEAVIGAGGGVVLMHDFDRDHDSNARESFVLETTEALLQAAEKEKLNVMTFSDLFAEDQT